MSKPHRPYRLFPTSSLIAASLTMSVIPTEPARAIVVYNSDSGGTQNLGVPANGQGVEYVGNHAGASATLVAPNVVITASHVARNPGNTFLFQGTSYVIDYVERVGTSDITLMHLTLSTGNPGAPLYNGVISQELDQGNTISVTMTGYGGPPGTVLTNNGQPYGYATSGARTNLTWGNNIVTDIISYQGYRHIAMPFVNMPGSCAYSAGDSGGGVFVNVNGTYMLAGVAHMIDAYWTAGTALSSNPNAPPSPNASGVFFNLSASNLYTIDDSGGTNQWVLADSSLPMMSYATLIDNDPNIRIGGKTMMQYLADRIDILQNQQTTATWTAKGTNRDWSTPANWSTNLPPLTAGSTAIFDGSGTQTAVNLNSIKLIGHLQFAGNLAYTLGGNAIHMDDPAGIATISSASSATQTIAAQLITTTASDLEITVSGAGPLILSGGINNAAGRTVTLTASQGSSLIAPKITNNNGTVIVNGPGSVNIASINGNLIFNANAMFDCSVDTPNPLVLTGSSSTITMPDGDCIWLNLVGDPAGITNATYELIRYGGGSPAFWADSRGTISELGILASDDGSIMLNNSWNTLAQPGCLVTFHIYDDQLGNILLDINVRTIIPEPASLALLGLGATTLLTRRRFILPACLHAVQSR